MLRLLLDESDHVDGSQYGQIGRSRAELADEELLRKWRVLDAGCRRQSLFDAKMVAIRIDDPLYVRRFAYSSRS
ncbi:hypothetical protein WK92_24475 [Burkholderia ubonensis]|nr:hypothetical protein WK82_15145 [Burkholderia ubonensis]KVW13728.1 hypothetical protein WK92_24475 [Burkholderia ubonensis]